MSDTNELVERLTGFANGTFTYKAYRGKAPDGVPQLRSDILALVAALAPVEAVPVVKPTHQADALEIAQRWAIWIADNIEGEDDEYGSLRSSFERDKATLFAALAHPPAQAGAVTEAQGWRLVPEEPTEAMYAAAEREWDGRMSARIAGVWKAMLAAAPTPPVNQSEGAGE